jgi:hypothetical protein
MLTTAFALAVIVAGAQGAPLEREPGRPFEMTPAETVTIQGVRITFDGVTADSRCPTGAQCVWAGDAAAAFRLEKSPDAKQLTLHTNGRFERQAEFAGFVVRLEDIKPYPKQGETIAAGDYRATLIVTKK